jgi:hypothetical protein
LVAGVFAATQDAGDASRAVAKDVVRATSGGEAVVAAAAAAVAGEGKTLVGAVTSLGEGSIRSGVKVDGAGYPVAVGVTFGEAALVNLPKGKGKRPGVTCCEGPAYELAMPAGVEGLPFTHALVNWNPDGHEPEGVYDVPHFDFHFYVQSSAEREGITAEGACLARCVKPLSAEETPAGYVMAPGGVPKMGGHWLPVTAPELRGGEFVKTFLYGAYDGRVTFLEPMITKKYLDGRPDFREGIAQPAKWPGAGFWPTEYVVRFDAGTREYTVGLEGMVRR